MFGGHFCGDENIVPVDAGFRDGLANEFLVVVTLGRVDVPVTCIQRHAHPVVAFITKALPCTIANLRNGADHFHFGTVPA